MKQNAGFLSLAAGMAGMVLLLGTSTTVALPPVADAGGPYGGDVGAIISFDGSASNDPDGNIVSWEWEFGDGATGTGPMPTHTYNEPGRYLVVSCIVHYEQSVYFTPHILGIVLEGA